VKQYIEIKDLANNTLFIDKNGMVTQDINKAHGYPKRVVKSILAQLAKASEQAGSPIGSFRARSYWSR